MHEPVSPHAPASDRAQYETILPAVWRGLAERSTLLIAVKDAAGRYVFANRRFITSFGLDGRFRTGLTDAELFPPPVANALHTVEDTGGGAESVQIRLPFAEGPRSFLIDRFTIDGEPGQPWSVWSAREVTRKAREESDMLASRALFKGILDIAADAIISVSHDQKIIAFNQGAERIFQYRAEEVLGEPLERLLPPDSRPGHHRHIAQFERGSAPARQMGERGTISGCRKDGTIFPAEASISRITIEGTVVFTAILRDVTQAQEAEEAIQALNADLRHRAMQLEHANRELESFSYSVSHDLRAPLRSIAGFSQVMVEDYAEAVGDEGKDYLLRIRDASQRMAQLIDDILNLSRLTRGGISRQAVNLSEIAESVAVELRSAEPDRAVTLIIAPELTADADPRLIRTALVNLLGNAWKYTSKHPTARVELGACDDADGRRVYFVKDDGAGFDMAYADKLFGAFQRLHGMKEYPGTGVGLATVQRIIHKHGGEIWAEAAIERGATFYFTLQ